MPAVSARPTKSHGSNGQESRTASKVWRIASLRRLSRRRHARRPDPDEEINQCIHLGWPDLLAICRHVAAPRRAVADLVDELIARQASADSRQVRPASAAAALQCMAVAAVLVLKHKRP